MAFERQATQYTETRAAASRFIDAFEALRKAGALYAAAGGSAFFDAFFAQANGPELTQAEFVAVMSTLDAITNLMAAGHYTNLAKARG